MPRAAGELVEGDPVALAAEAKLHAVVHEALALQALAHPHLDEQVDRALLEHAGADPSLHVLAVAVLEDDRLDALEVEEVPEHEARRPRADDPDLRVDDVRCAHASNRLTSSPPG